MRTRSRPSTRSSRSASLRLPIPATGWGAVLLLLLGVTGAAPADAPPADSRLEVVATGVVRPLQLAWAGRTLVVLSPGALGDAAAELYRLSPDTDLPIDLSTQTPRRIPFRGQPATLGSLAVDPATGALFLGEENGSRIWRLDADDQVTLYATGLRRLAGGSALAFDTAGRLLVIDYVDPLISPPQERLPPAFEQFREDDYRGPLVLRVTVRPPSSAPRRMDNVPPLFPRAWGGRAGGRMLPVFISVAPGRDGDVLLLTSTGELQRLSGDGSIAPFARLPRGQYNRTNMVATPDGGLYVSGGFHVGQVFRVSNEGEVTIVASGLADPAGIALDPQGALYIAESSRHRILRAR